MPDKFRRDHCGGSDLPARGGKGWPQALPPLPSPAPHQRRKRGGRSLHQHPSRAARCCVGRVGDTRGAASLRFSAADAGNPCCPASDAAFRGTPTPQRRGARPLREKRRAYQDRRHVRSPPPRLKGGGPSDGTGVTPRGGNRRSFQGHWSTPIVPPLGGLSEWRHQCRHGVQGCPNPCQR